ncbi:MAG: hypothetical protein M1833_005375 [Piccolia ochrophora]|nr:MAG: hypothetical protein M1833_005375 [Piccolia ochrophora]
MYYQLSSILGAAVLVVPILASPAPIPAPKPAYTVVFSDVIANGPAPTGLEKRDSCGAVKKVVNDLKLVSKLAYPFCSSYIRIPKVTQTSTVAITTTAADVTTATTITPTDTSFVTVTETATVTAGATPPLGKRDISLPPYVSKYVASQVSQACSCLSIPKATTTVTASVQTTLPPKTITGTVTATPVTTTSTVTTTTTTTVTPIPDLCDDANLNKVFDAFQTADAPGVSYGDASSPRACCLDCNKTKDCLAFYLYGGQCRLYTTPSKGGPLTGPGGPDKCPTGITSDTKQLGNYEFIRQFASNPSNTVIGTVRDKKATEKKLAADGIKNVTLFEADITDLPALKKVAAETAELTGGSLDYLINNAGYISDVSAYKTLADFEDDFTVLEKDLLQCFNVNTVGIIKTTNALIPLLQKGKAKKVISLSTGLGDLDFTNQSEIPYSPSYSISKAALNAVVAKYNTMYKKDGILFLAISPGVVDTGNPGNAPPPEGNDMGQKFGAWASVHAPDFAGPISTEESVKAMLKVVENASVEKGDGGSFVSHLGNKKWL